MTSQATFSLQLQTGCRGSRGGAWATLRPDGISWRLHNRASDNRPCGSASSGDNGCRCYHRGGLPDRVSSNFSFASGIAVFGGPLSTGSDLPVDGPWSTPERDAHQIRFLGFSREWYERAFAGAEVYELSSGRHIRLISAPYFLLTKLTAFEWRGHGDYASSRPGGFSRRGRRPAASFTRDRSTGNRCSRPSCEASLCLAGKQKFCRFIAGPSARRSW